MRKLSTINSGAPPRTFDQFILYLAPNGFTPDATSCS